MRFVAETVTVRVAEPEGAEPDAKTVAGMAETAPKPPFSTAVGPAAKERLRDETGVRRVLFTLS